MKTPIMICGGWLDGHMIRRARKATHCKDYRHCHHEIAIGDLYAEGFCDPDFAGGFGLEKFCLSCAGEEARAVVAAQGA